MPCGGGHDFDVCGLGYTPVRFGLEVFRGPDQKVGWCAGIRGRDFGVFLGSVLFSRMRE